MVKLPQLIFGVVLIIIWAILRFKPTKLANPSKLEAVQNNLLSAIRGSSIETALLTAGLLSIALSF